MRHVKTTLWIIAFGIAVFVQYRYCKYVSDEAYRNEAKKDKLKRDSLGKLTDSLVRKKERYRE